MVTAISLFSGAVDGLAIAAQAAGITVTHHIEWDAWCCRVLRMNHPDSIVLNKDIHDVHNLPSADIVFGGSPCQGWSTGGNQLGFSDPRYLWPEMLRIVEENRPRVVIHENVRGGVSKGLLDKICGDLESAGYETTPVVFPACVFGAPHERYRMFIIGLMAHTDTLRRDESQYQQNPCNDFNGINSSSERTGRTEFHAPVSSGEVLDITTSAGLSHSEQSQRWQNSAQNRTGMDDRLKRSSQDVVNPTDQHHANIGTGTGIARLNLESAGSNRSGGKHSIDDCAQFRQLPNEERPLSQPAVGMSSNGLAARIPRLDAVRDFPGWPAGQGIYQHAYEPARTTSIKGRYAKEQIQALGNAVVWQQAAPIFRAVVRWLESQS